VIVPMPPRIIKLPVRPVKLKKSKEVIPVPDITNGTSVPSGNPVLLKVITTGDPSVTVALL
jgi:hypothetical protein